MSHKPLLSSLNPKNILVRMPNWLGDFVMATPILKDLRNHFPEAKITALCQGPLSAVIQEDPTIDQVLTFKRPKKWFNSKERQDITDPLQKGQYDLGVLLTNSFSSAYWLWKGSVKNRLGFDTHWRSLLLDHPIPFPAERNTQHLVKTYKMLLEPMGISVSNTDPYLHVTETEKNEIRKKLAALGIKNNQIIVGINPGAAYGSAKCWLPDRFRQVTEKLLEDPNIVIVYMGDKQGAPLVEEICQNLSSRVINLAGKTSLRELIAAIQCCQLFLTNDSGPMHVASALNVPLLALFGSTSDVTTSPYKGGKVIHKHVACSPCYRRECPIDFRCMKSIESLEVYQELKQMIESEA